MLLSDDISIVLYTEQSLTDLLCFFAGVSMHSSGPPSTPASVNGVYHIDIGCSCLLELSKYATTPAFLILS